MVEALAEGAVHMHAYVLVLRRAFLMAHLISTGRDSDGQQSSVVHPEPLSINSLHSAADTDTPPQAAVHSSSAPNERPRRPASLARR